MEGCERKYYMYKGKNIVKIEPNRIICENIFAELKGRKSTLCRKLLLEKGTSRI